MFGCEFVDILKIFLFVDVFVKNLIVLVMECYWLLKVSVFILKLFIVCFYCLFVENECYISLWSF